MKRPKAKIVCLILLISLILTSYCFVQAQETRTFTSQETGVTVTLALPHNWRFTNPGGGFQFAYQPDERINGYVWDWKASQSTARAEAESLLLSRGKGEDEAYEGALDARLGGREAVCFYDVAADGNTTVVVLTLIRDTIVKFEVSAPSRDQFMAVEQDINSICNNIRIY